jgi:hypothetical protein
VSGFVGEVFSHFFALVNKRFVVNPHADGRPDLIDIVSEPAAEYYSRDAFPMMEMAVVIRIEKRWLHSVWRLGGKSLNRRYQDEPNS